MTRTALGARLLVVAALTGAGAWLIGGGWRFRPSSPWWIELHVGVVLPSAAVFSMLGLLLWSLRRSRRSATLEMDRRAFVAPPAYLCIGAIVASLIGLAAAITANPLRRLERQHEGNEDLLLAVMSYAVLGAAAAIVVLALGMAVVLFRKSHRVELRPEGLRLVTLFITRDVPWEAMEPGPPVLSSGHVVVRIGRPDLVTGRRIDTGHPSSVSLPGLVEADPRLVAYAINVYLQFPESRAAIGTPEEHERLHNSYAAAS